MSPVKTTCAIAIGFCGALAAQAGGASLPDSLAQAFERRERLMATAHLAVASRTHAVDGADGRGWFYEWRYANGRIAMTYHGNTDGVVIQGSKGDDNTPDLALIRELGVLWDAAAQQVWSHDPESVLGYVDRRGGRKFWRIADLRFLGADPRKLRPIGAPEFADYSFEEDIIRGGRVLVRARRDNTELVWRIDPSRGWFIEHMELKRDGKTVSRTEATAQFVDGRWYPRKLEQYRGEARTPRKTIEVLAAEFDHADHAVELGPAAIGIEVGTYILNNRDHTQGIWDGEAVIDPGDYYERVAQGVLHPGPRAALALARQRALNERWTAQGLIDREAPADDWRDAAVAPDPGAWEAYVRAFIRRYALNDDQQQRAWAIYRDCKDKAEQYVRSKRAALSALETERAALASLPTGAQAEQRVRLERRSAALRAPLTRIFETQLQPRLEKLPTRRQRAAAREKEAEDGKRENAE